MKVAKHPDAWPTCVDCDGTGKLSHKERWWSLPVFCKCLKWWFNPEFTGDFKGYELTSKAEYPTGGISPYRRVPSRGLTS